MPAAVLVVASLVIGDWVATLSHVNQNLMPTANSPNNQQQRRSALCIHRIIHSPQQIERVAWTYSYYSTSSIDSDASITTTLTIIDGSGSTQNTELTLELEGSSSSSSNHIIPHNKHVDIILFLLFQHQRTKRNPNNGNRRPTMGRSKRHYHRPWNTINSLLC